MPPGGVGGRITSIPGYHLDELRVPTADGRVLAYGDAAAVGTDIIDLDTGETVTLNGLFGTNLLLLGVRLAAMRKHRPGGLVEQQSHRLGEPVA